MVNPSGGFGSGYAAGTAYRECVGYPTLYCPGVTKWAITAAGAPGVDGDRYVLEYVRIFQDTLDGQFHRTFRFHVEGTIQLPVGLTPRNVQVRVFEAGSPQPKWTRNVTL